MSHFLHRAGDSYASYLAAGGVGELGDDEPSGLETLLLGEPTVSAEPGDTSPNSGCFHWGRPEELLRLPALAASLGDLKNQAQNPTHMWALEQFDLARTSYRQGLAAEALTSLRQALTGNDERPGYALDFRFHFLRGLLHLGSFRLAGAATLDLPEAGEAFAEAAQRARSERPLEAAWATLGAAWAAYAQGLMTQAAEHAEAARTLQPALAPAHFLAAKILAHQQNVEPALAAAATALRLEPAWARPLLRDADFQALKDRIVALVEAERDHRGSLASQAIKRARDLAVQWGGPDADTRPSSPDDPAGPAWQLLQQARDHFRANTLPGYLAAMADAEAAGAALSGLIARSRQAELLARDAVESAREIAQRVADLQVGPYRLGTVAFRELGRARTCLEEAETACRSKRLGDFLHAEQQAQRAHLALRQAIEQFQALATREATAERERLQDEIARRHRRTPEGSGVYAGATVGAGISLFPAVYLCLIGPRDGTIMRAVLTLVIVVGIGALLGALFAPYYRTPAGTGASSDSRLAAIDRTLQELRTLPLKFPSNPGKVGG